MSKPNIEMKAMGALLSNVDFTKVPQETVDWINQHPKDAGVQLTRWLKNRCCLIIDDLKVIPIDRSKHFNPEKFIGKGWKIDEEDKQSLVITKLHLIKVEFVDMLTRGDSSVQGEEKLRRLKKAGHIRLDAKMFQTLWDDQSLIPESWKEKINWNTRYIYFDGSVLQDPNGNRYVLCLYWDGGRWDWCCRCLRLNFGDFSPSVVIAS